MRRWWDKLIFLGIVLIAAAAIYVVWPDEPDRYLPDFLNLPSGEGVPSGVAEYLPCNSDDSDTSDAADCKGMRLGLDLQGGSRIVLEANLQGQTDIDPCDAIQDAKEIVESRINPFGVSESQVQTSGCNRLIVELPGVSAETARDVTRPAVLMFCEPLQEGFTPAQVQGGLGNNVATSPRAGEVYYKPGTCEPDVDAEGNVALADQNGNLRRGADGAVERLTPVYQAGAATADQIIWTPAKGELGGAPVIMTGSYLERNTDIVYDSFGNPALIFRMNDDGEDVFGSLTRRIQGLPLATFLDGEPVRGRDGQVIAPVVQGEITDVGQTTGLSNADARRLRTFLNIGAFPIPMVIVAEQNVDATLGDEAVQQSVEAGIVALVVIMVFMILYYRLPGLLASAALLVYTALVLAIFKIGLPEIGPVTLTLAGVAGFVLSVGMAVDANILIFERMKEELRNGRSLLPAIDAGFSRAWTSIRDSNISTMITCAILYWFGDAFASSLIKGFALTLAIGVVVSMFSAITVTQTFLGVASSFRFLRRLWLWTDDTPEDAIPARARGVDVAAEAADA